MHPTVSQEDRTLLDSVRDWSNQPEELTQRVKEAPLGLTPSEREMIRRLPSKSRVLDIGCAAGRASIALAKEGHRVVGIDIAENLIAVARQQAREHGVNVEFHVYEPLTLPFPDASFDAVLMLKVYCYQPRRAKRLSWLHEVERVLRPEGWLFLSQFIIDGIKQNYEETYDDNYRRIASRFATLEAGDNFTTPRGKPERWSYLHFFTLRYLSNELFSTDLRIVDEFGGENIEYFVMQKPRLEPLCCG